MKKTVVATVLVLAALAVSVTGVAFAQSPQPPAAGSTVEGPLHDYMINAMAAALGITPSDFEARLATGKTAYQIALDLGISADKIPALLADARAKAFDAAVVAGVVTQQQANWMNSHGTMQMAPGTCTVTGGVIGRMARGGR